MKEAEAKREEEEAWGLPGYKYHYHSSLWNRFSFQSSPLPRLASQITSGM